MENRNTARRLALVVGLALAAVVVAGAPAEACYTCKDQMCWVVGEGFSGKKNCTEVNVHGSFGTRPMCTLPTWSRTCTGGAGGNCNPDQDACKPELDVKSEVEVTPNGEPSPAFEVELAATSAAA